MFDPFIQKAFDKIREAGLAPVYLEQINLLEQHIAFLDTRLAAAEKDLARAEGKLETQEQELEKLRSQLDAFDGKAKCVEIGPCLIKKAPDGKPLNGVYCPHCRSVMQKGQFHAYSDTCYYMCCKCKFEVPAAIIETALNTYPA